MSTANAPSVDIKDMIQDMFSASDSSSVFDLIFGENLFIASQPELPNIVATVYDTGGIEQGQYGLESVNIQIRVRHTDYAQGYALIRDIKYHLHNARNNEIWNGTRYIGISARSDILFLGQDHKNRYEWTVNFLVQRSGI